MASKDVVVEAWRRGADVDVDFDSSGEVEFGVDLEFQLTHDVDGRMFFPRDF